MKIKRFFILFFFLISTLFSDGAKNFVENSFSKEAKVVKKSDNDLIENGKFADIYYIEEGGKTTAVLKQFNKVPSSARDYRKEIKAFKDLERSQALPYSELLLSGEDSNYYFIIMKCAKGKSLNTLLKEVGSSKFSRSSHLNTFLKGVKKTGEHLRAFHLRHKNQKLLLPEGKESFDHQRFDYFYSRDNPIKGIDLEKIAEREKELKKKIARSHPILGQVHGDLHIGNIFFDKESEEITFIDFSTMNYPLQKKEGMPIAGDAIKCLISLKVLSKTYGLSPKEIRLIEEAFFEGYGRDMMSEDEIEYYTLLEVINLIECYDKEKELSPIYHCSLHILKTLV